MLQRLRPGITRLFTPVARALMRVGVTADVVTVVGTAGVATGALVFFPRGSLFGGTIFITCFVFADSSTGCWRERRGPADPGGPSSTRPSTGLATGRCSAVSSGGTLRGGHQPWLAALALTCLIGGVVVSYAKAKAESLGFTCDVGIAERAERLVVILAGTGLSGLGVPYVAAVALWGLAVATLITVGQRLTVVHRQATAARLPSAALVEPTR